MSIKENFDLVILAGGRGTRISRFTKKIPKPLLKINNLQFIQYLINFYSKYPFRKIFILTGYKGEKFNKFNKSLSNLIPIECIKERKKLDTGGALYQLKNKVQKNFILINGDSFIDYDIKKFIQKKLSQKYIGKILLINHLNNKSNKKLNNLKILNNDDIVLNGKLMNAGVYHFNRKIFKYLKPNKSSLETEILPYLIQKKLFKGFYVKEKLLDIGSYANLNKAKKFLKKYVNRFSVFLDRDGVVNKDLNYVYKIKDFVFRKNAIKALKYLNKNNINIFIVTNQAGIAKGYYTEKKFFNLSNYIRKVLLRKNIYINDLEYCPYHPLGKIKKYKKKSNFRKPGNLMLEKIIKKWGIKTSKSVMIGDKISDKKAASKSKIYFEYVEKDLFKQLKKLNKKLN